MKLSGEKLEAGERSGQEALMMFIPWIRDEYDKCLNQLKGNVRLCGNIPNFV